MRTTVGYWCGIAVLLTWVSFASVPQADARTLAHAAPGCFNNSCYYIHVLDDLRWAAELVETVQPAPGQTSRGWRSERASLLEGIEFDWRPLFVLGVGEILGHIVRGVTGDIKTRLTNKKHIDWSIMEYTGFYTIPAYPIE